jgi:hypothetical protein
MTPGQRSGVAQRNAAKTHCTLCPVPHPYDGLNSDGHRFCRTRQSMLQAICREKKKREAQGRPRLPRRTGALAWIYEKEGPRYE